MQVTNKNLCLFLNLERILYGVLSSYLIQENAQLFLFFYVIVHVGFLNYIQERVTTTALSIAVLKRVR